MRWWHVAGIVAVLVLAFILASQPAGPKIRETNTPVSTEKVRVIVLDENGNEINAYVWQNGTYWCAEKEGYLGDCVGEENGTVRIILRRNPGEKWIDLNVIGCEYMAYGPKGAPVLGPINCGKVRIHPGRYEFVFFNENGRIMDRKDLFVSENADINVEGNAEGNVAVIRAFDEVSGKEINAWVSFDGIALYGSEVRVPVQGCETVHVWAPEHKMMDAYVCPGDEENVSLPKQVNGGTAIVSTVGAERIIVTDLNGRVYGNEGGPEAVFRDVPPGAYRIFAIRGAAFTYRGVDVSTNQVLVNIDEIRGRATIETDKTVQIIAMGQKIFEGSGRITVPAETVLHVVILENPPREETLVLLPGEVRQV